MSVQMHGMGRLILVVHYNTNGLVATEVVNVPFRVQRVRKILLVRQKEYWFVIVGTLSLIVHRPDVVTATVCNEVDFNGLSRVWSIIYSNGIYRNGFLQVVLEKNELHRIYKSTRMKWC